MKKLLNKFRNLLTATAGTTVTEPKMVTKEFPKSIPMTSVPNERNKPQKKISWTGIINLFCEFAYYMGKLIGSTFMWSILLFVAGHFVPELRYKVLPPLYNFVDLYLYCVKAFAGFLWDFLMKFSA